MEYTDNTTNIAGLWGRGIPSAARLVVVASSQRMSYMVK